MRHRIHATFATMLVAMSAWAPPLAAQGTVQARFGDWEERCETPAGSPRQQCALVQRVGSGGTPDVSLVVVALKGAGGQGRLLRVIAPLGVLLPSGLAIKADQADVGRVGFVRCLPSGCVAEVQMDDALFATLRDARHVTLTVSERADSPVGVDMLPKGIGEGFDRLP